MAGELTLSTLEELRQLREQNAAQAEELKYLRDVLGYFAKLPHKGYTRGPWTFKGSSITSPYPCYFGHIPYCGDERKHYGGFLVAESIGNPHNGVLMAAAPELLDAIRDCGIQREHWTSRLYAILDRLPYCEDANEKE